MDGGIAEVVQQLAEKVASHDEQLSQQQEHLATLYKGQAETRAMVNEMRAKVDTLIDAVSSQSLLLQGIARNSLETVKLLERQRIAAEALTAETAITKVPAT